MTDTTCLHLWFCFSRFSNCSKTIETTVKMGCFLLISRLVLEEGLEALFLPAAQFWLPDSPRWLMLSGQGKPAARSAVERLRGKFADQGSVQAEVEDMAKTCQSNQAKAGTILTKMMLCLALVALGPAKVFTAVLHTNSVWKI